MTTEIIYQDEIGEGSRPPGPSFNDIGLSDAARVAFTATYGDSFQLSPPQSWAIQNNLLEGDAHFLICAATNSGKTLIAYLRMLHRLAEAGRRFVYVVPLKALAEEKAAELEQLCERMAGQGGPEAKVAKSTGDYQLTTDFLGSAPPESGEIIVCTPERLEVIARNPDNIDWLRGIDTFVLDEFHLLGEKQRGANMECLVTRALTLCPDASVLALSATIGNPAEIEGWLAHTGKTVEKLVSEFRYPVLHRKIVSVEDKDDYLAEAIGNALDDSQASVLVFVYRKADAERFAKRLIDEADMASEVAFFHAGLSVSMRSDIAERFRAGSIRVLITTTSLKMGVNTPATHVFVRDTVFIGSGRLTAADIEQMIGRAGRGDTPGTGEVICGTSEDSQVYAEAFTAGKTTDITPQLFGPADESWANGSQKPNWANRRQKTNRANRRQRPNEPDADPVAAAVLAEIARHEHITTANLEDFFSHTFSGWLQAGERPDYSQQLTQLERDKLTYKVENSESTYAPTKLGRTVAWCGLSPESGAMLASFIRALIRLGQKEEEGDGKRHDYLRRLTDIDLLFLAVASFEGRRYVPGRISAKRRGEVEAKIEALDPEFKPLLNQWRSAESADRPTRRLLSSLRFPREQLEKNSESLFYRLMMVAMLLYEHSQGRSLEELADDYGMRMGELETGLKFTSTWLLNCLAQICTPDRCYNLNFLAMRCYGLLENLSFGSTLGKLLSVKGIGRRTVQKLVDSEISSFSALMATSGEQLEAIGIAKNQSNKVLRFARRASR